MVMVQTMVVFVSVVVVVFVFVMMFVCHDLFFFFDLQNYELSV